MRNERETAVTGQPLMDRMIENRQVEKPGKEWKDLFMYLSSETQSSSVLRRPLADSLECKPNTLFASILALKHDGASDHVTRRLI